LSDQPSLQDLTKLVLFSGRLSEVHVKNLEAFPFIFFNGVEEAKIEHDISTVKDIPSTVFYDLTLNEDNDHIEYRCKTLEDAVRSLFWNEVKLKISINSEEVYKSE
jgi:hypothetical protein